MITLRGGAGQRFAALLGALVLAAAGMGTVRADGPGPRAAASATPGVSDRWSGAVHTATFGSETERHAERDPESDAGTGSDPDSEPDADAVATHAGRETPGIVPTRVRIPAIDVDADVVELGLQPDRTLEVPTDFAQTGWWTGGSRPGADGPAVVVGHVDSRRGPAVFFRLRDLRRGDVIVLTDDDGRRVRFRVDRTEQHAKDAFPTTAVYGDTDGPTLRLVTCGGAFDRSARSYVDNLIVFASPAR